MNPVLGSALALGAAVFWAGAVILYKKSGDLFSPVALNLYKSIVAFVLVGATMLALNIPFFPEKPASHWWLLAASGFLGITLADMFFFMALKKLGAGLVAVSECAYLPLVIIFSFILLGERLSPAGIAGGILVLMAIVMGSVAGSVHTAHTPDQATDRRNIFYGMIFGILSMIFLSLGIVMVKSVLEDADIFWATLVRVSAGIVSLAAVILLHPGRRRYMEELKFSRAWIVALPASVAGNYLALICWMGGMKYITASKAAILNQMSTIFIFIFAALFLKERITANRTIAIILAVSGALLTLLN